MGDLSTAVSWPPAPIRTDRLTLRATRAEDRAAFIDLHCSPEVRRYLGGTLRRDQLERDAPTVPAARPGVFAITVEDDFIGTVGFDRRDRDQPGHIRPEGGELEVSYVLRSEFWGHGYAFEAVDAALNWAAGELPDDDVILCTQVANTRSRRLAERLGFIEAGRFHLWEADQWLGARRLSRLSSTGIHSHRTRPR